MYACNVTSIVACQAVGLSHDKLVCHIVILRADSMTCHNKRVFLEPGIQRRHYWRRFRLPPRAPTVTLDDVTQQVVRRGTEDVAQALVYGFAVLLRHCEPHRPKRRKQGRACSLVRGRGGGVLRHEPPGCPYCLEWRFER